MSLLRFLGLSDIGKQARERGEPATVRRIAAQLERLEPAAAKHLASFAYVLARVAQADLAIVESETSEMERIVRALASLSEGEAALVVQIAKTQAHVLGDTENYVVTREFRRITSREQRAQLLQCVYAVAAADGTSSGVESSVIHADPAGLRAISSAPAAGCAARARRAGRSGPGCRGP
jgi:uncharacterized tellurite resistance protein B-like protein